MTTAPTPDVLDRLAEENGHSIVLTVGDHEQNGFVHLVEWRRLSEREARELIAAVDSSVTDESEPDNATDSFSFILDLCAGPHDTIDNGKRFLPTQVAMSLAPEQVQCWLNSRPDPDSLVGRRIPDGSTDLLRAKAALAQELGR